MTSFHFEVASYISNASNSNDRASRSSQKERGAMTILPNKKKSLEAKLTLFSKVTQGGVEITLPVRTVSEVNCTEHWTKKHKRHKLQQKILALALKTSKCQIKLPCHIKLIRYAPKKLDKHDNLPISMKYILDACCAIITGDYRPGRADDDERISISYDQVQYPHYGVKILITF
jgi:hypothetical protein